MRNRRRSKKTTRRMTNPAKRMLWRQIGIGTLLTLSVGLLLWGTWHVTRLPGLTIATVDAVGGITIEPDGVVAHVNDELAGTYYRLVPKRFVYLYPHDAIQARLATIPRMQDVQVDRTGRVLTIRYTEFEPFALWCTDQVEDCVFIDQTGYGFASAPSLRGGAFVRYLNAEQAPEVGTIGVPDSVLRTATGFIDTAAVSFGFRPFVVWFDDRDIVYRLGGGGEIRTSREDSVAQVLTNVETILDSPEFNHLAPGAFEYIDLRFGNKVFVQEEVPELATSTATTTE